ncbi:MAG: hypothetical protein HY052_00155, partial [Proteobacteria bacterium]|nr:hypothetical protein [Pseudomonadota bacterium]
AWVLRQQHLESARNIASDVIASIISRRTSIPPPSGTDLSLTLRPLREKAGIDPATMPDGLNYKPSYNEIMLTMTKERFYDPGYFVRMQEETGAIKQEEASISTFITMQYQDIYKLQEQINALLAARAALKFNSDIKSGQVESNPLR